MEKSLKSCIKEVQRLDGIISHFLKAIRPSDPDFKKINLLQVIEETVRIREKELNAKKISVSMEAGVREPMIHADVEQIKQVFFNVIGNALDAVGEKSTIRIVTGIDDHYVFAKIVDQGIGIKKEDISRVFEPYFTTKKSGHGIGMMIVHRIMRDHGGEVGIDSKEGSGTIVTLNFPRKSIRRTLLGSAESD
jgi:signal transduction histidine kinase